MAALSWVLWSLGGGLVWDADGLRLAVGKSVEEGPVAGG